MTHSFSMTINRSMLIINFTLFGYIETNILGVEGERYIANICKCWANMVKKRKHKVSLGITIKTNVNHTLNLLLFADIAYQKRKLSV